MQSRDREYLKTMFTLRNYKIEYFPFGLLAIIFIMIPNLGYIFYTPTNDILGNQEASFWLWNALEYIGRFGLMITLGLVVNKRLTIKKYYVTHAISCVFHKVSTNKDRSVFLMIFGSLIAYYILWVCYFIGIWNRYLFIGMAVLPSLFFIFISWQLKNGFSLVFSLLFALMHIFITATNFLF